MSEKTPHRRPATFKLGDPGVVVMGPDETGRPARGTVHITPEADPATLPVPIDVPRVPERRGFRWGTLFWSAAGGLVLLASGLGVVNLIEDLFARSETLGYVALAFAAAAAQALAVVIGREAFGLARLAAIEKLHQRATEVLRSDDRVASRAVVNDLLKLAHQNPQLARARATLLSHVIGHLAITGGMAVGDSLVQQMLGHGIAAKLSQRLGEGVLNGLLTARLGLAAIDVTRPLPFTALPRPALADLAKDLLRK